MENITIIIPMYNAEKSIEKCVMSVATQVDINDEIIIINDGSTDNSLEICNRLKKQYSCIKIINQENKGVGSARNSGIVNAKCDWICFLDSDDFADGNMIKNIKKYLNEKYDIVMFEHINEDRKNKITVNNEQFVYDKSTCGKLVEACFIADNQISAQIDMRSVWANVYRKEFLISNNIFFNTKIEIGEDMLFLLYNYLNLSNAMIVKVPIYHYYFQNEGSLTNKYKPELFSNIMELNKEILSILPSEKKYLEWYSFYRLNDIILLMKYTLFHSQNREKLSDKKKQAKNIVQNGKYKEYYLQAKRSKILKKYSLSKRATFWLAVYEHIYLLYIIYRIRYMKK